MHFNKKLFTITGLLAGVVFMASMTTIQQVPQQQGPQQQPKYTNLKVLPRNITKKQLDAVMGEWGKALGVRCNFCHANNPATNKTDFALDTKPEKLMAREMVKMAAKINKKYFHAQKDTLGMVALSSVNCNTCHRGLAHPKAVLANVRTPGAPAGPSGFGGTSAAPRPATPTAPPAATPVTTPTNR